MNWFLKNNYPDYWNSYSSEFDGKQEQNLSSLRFVVFDTETTGLNISKDRILSIGCIAITDLKIKVSDQLEIYISQEKFNADSVKIHGLLKKGTFEKLSEKEAIKRFLDYIGNSVLVAHHAAFDVSMINNCLKRLNLPKLKNVVLDTGHLYYKTKPNNQMSHWSLDHLAQVYNIPLHDRHTASGDAYITALIFLKILPRLVHNQPIQIKNLIHKRRIGLL